jgi:succinoglycan biosynthesis protein ExoM
MRACICICTYQRDDLLENLLGSLSGVVLEGAASSVAVEVMVIDNACSQKTADMCERISSTINMPLSYFAEPNRGISQARNRAVAETLLAGADMLAFVDDDDLPRANWLSALVNKRLKTGVDIVFGCWVLGPEVPEWARDSSLFKSLEKPGDSLKKGEYGLPWMASTCNVLIGKEILEKVALEGSVFKEKFSQSGGEDKDFFIRAVNAGATFESEEGSILIRHHEPERFRVSGLMQRGFKNGCSRMNKTRQHGTRLKMAQRFVLAFFKMIWVVFSLLFCLFSRRLLMGQLYRLGKAAGVIYALLTGRSYGYYST